MSICVRDCWLTALGLACHAAVSAQVPINAPEPTVRPIPYVDRLIDGLVSSDKGKAVDFNDHNPEGWVRQLRFDSRLGYDSMNGTTGKTSSGVALNGFIETPNHGIVSIHAQSGTSPAGGLLTARQRGLPWGRGWQLNNEVGATVSLSPSVMRAASRVSAPGFFLQGISTEWLNEGRGLQVQASTGRAGRISGTLVDRLHTLPGSVTTLGAQTTDGPWTLAARTAQARDLSLTDTPLIAEEPINALSTQLSARHESEGRATQLNVIRTRDSLRGKTPGGLWIDSDTRGDSRGVNGGMFWLDPGLSWAGQPMASDLVGAYLNKTWQTRQWSADSSVEFLRTISEPSKPGVFTTGSLRWRYSRSLSAAVGASLRRLGGVAGSAYSELRWQNGASSSGLRLDLSTEQGSRRVQQLTLDHDWGLTGGWAASTNVGAGRSSAPLENQKLWNAAASIHAPLTGQLLLRGNLNLSSEGADQRYTAVNTGLSWRMTPQWSLEASYYLSQGKTRPQALIDPLAVPLAADAVTNNTRSVFVALRWEDRAGTASVPLGGNVRQGGARVEGTVFLDANSNGRQEASEIGAAGVTVFLDNRYVARTDAQGRYEFAFVGSGSHVITVQNETLPLPWAIKSDGWMKLDIRPREDQRIDFAVRRHGD